MGNIIQHQGQLSMVIRIVMLQLVVQVEVVEVIVPEAFSMVVQAQG
jgi:hypothetical protein